MTKRVTFIIATRYSGGGSTQFTYQTKNTDTGKTHVLQEKYKYKTGILLQ